MSRRILLCLLLNMLVGCASIFTLPSETKTQNRLMYKNEVTERDKKGRAKITLMKTPYGSCMSEIVYSGTGGTTPEIHIVLMKNGRMRNIGYLVLRNKKEEVLTEETLLYFFEEAAKMCLPQLLPGYSEV